MVAELSSLAPVAESYKEESERKTELVTLDLLGGRGDPDPADRAELDLELQVTAGWARRLVPLVCPLAHISIHFDFSQDLVLPLRSFPFWRESAVRIRKGGEILLLPYLHCFLRNSCGSYDETIYFQFSPYEFSVDEACALFQRFRSRIVWFCR